ncbi:MAG: hypothetical protein JXR41_10225, partial [Bacteroidales bacterium]|nr:hypothetical protein [Bacteroidales bacterium]MBN2763457.1 hypothetical protein [Bacteroidales bacterium]
DYALHNLQILCRDKRIKKKNKLVGISLLTHITWHAFLPAETAVQAGFLDTRSQLICFAFLFNPIAL